MPQEKKKPEYKLCPKGHQNSPNAKTCWVCGESLDQPPKPQFTQKTNTAVTTVTTSPPVEFKGKDLNIAEEECARYAPGRERCDEKDPTGHYCVFYSMGCGIRTKRFKNKTP